MPQCLLLGALVNSGMKSDTHFPKSLPLEEGARDAFGSKTV